jgi:hypothetical protein
MMAAGRITLDKYLLEPGAIVHGTLVIGLFYYAITT